MTFSKIINYDLQNGIIRWRYIMAPLLIMLPVLDLLIIIKQNSLTVSCWDTLFFLFRGNFPASIQPGIGERIELPTTWLYVVGCSLLLNLDYMPNDLSLYGQQIIIRCRKKKYWYLSKCIWNISSTACFFMLIILASFVLSLIYNKEFIFILSPHTNLILLGIEGDSISLTRILSAGLVLPFATLLAINLLEMMLCLFLQPVFSFMICICVALLATLKDHTLILGCGAMVIRNISITTHWILLIRVVYSIFIGLVAIFVGVKCFSRKNILPGAD